MDLSHHNLSQLLPQIGNSNSLPPNQKSDSSLPEQEVSDAQKTARSKLGGNLIHVMADHADNMAAIDSMLPHGQRQDAFMGRYGNQDWWRPFSFPGLEDSEDSIGQDFEMVDVRPYDARTESIVGDVNCWLESASLTNCIRNCRKTVDAAKSRSTDAEFSEKLHHVLPHCGDGLLRLQHAATGSSLR